MRNVPPARPITRHKSRSTFDAPKLLRLTTVRSRERSLTDAHMSPESLKTIASCSLYNDIAALIGVVGSFGTRC